MNYHQNNQMNNTQPVEMVSQLYDLGSISNNFQFSIGTPFNDIEQMSPKMCMATAHEIQEAAKGNGPVRVNMFNYMSQNAFNNQNFRELCGTVIARVVLGMTQREQNDITQMANAAINNLVRWFSAYAACQNPNVLANCPSNVVNQLHADSKQWEKQAMMVAGQVPYEPFSASRMSETLGNSNNAWSASISNGGMQDSGAFVASGSHRHHEYTKNGNNSSGRHTNRFQAQLERQRAMLQGSMQAELQKQKDNINSSPIHSGGAVDEARYSSLSQVRREQLRRQQIRTGKIPADSPMDSVTAAATGQATSSVTAPGAVYTPPAGGMSRYQELQAQEFAHPIEETVIPVSSPAPAPQVEEIPTPKSFIMMLEVDGVEYGVTRKLAYEDKGDFKWRPSDSQMHHPAWNPRLHKIAYFELETGDWAAVIIVKEPVDKDAILFRYEAHCIDPTMGIPEPHPTCPPPLPPKNDDVKYEKPVNPTFTRVMHVAVDPDNSAVTSEGEHAEDTLKELNALERKPTAYFSQASIVDVNRYETRDEMLEDLATIKGFAVCSDWKSLIPMISKIRNKRTREDVVKNYTKAVNMWLRTRLGVEEFIQNFVEDGLAIIDHIGAEYGSKAMAALIRDQVSITFDAFQVERGDGREDIISAVYGTRAAKSADSTLILLKDTGVIVLDGTTDKMEVEVQDTGAALVNGDIIGVTDALVKAGFASIHKNNNMGYINLITSTDERYRVARSAMDPEKFLISRWSPEPKID